MNQIYIALFYFLMSYSDCQILQSSYIVGDIEYSVDINQGESIITVPIPNLKGVNNFQPEISLVYRSNNYLLHKEFGLGWSLNGLFEISRCSKTFAHDNRFDNIKFDNSDKFCLNDQRLILVEGNYGANNSIYQTEMQSYKKIIAYGDSNVPSYFKIFTSDNQIMWLGRSDDSKLSSNDVTFKWMLNKIEDYLGNAIYFTYLKDTNYCYLKTIEYANKQIDFFYTKSLNNQTSYYSNQILTSTNSLLKLVVFSAKNNYNNLTKLKSYEFSYKKYMPIGYNILKQIKMCYADKKCVRPLSFDYDDENSQANKFSKSIKKDNICGNKASTCELKQMIDVNGDNILDIVAFGYDGVYVSLNIENEYFSDAQIWISEFVEKTGWKSTKHYRFMADVDSDGLPDIVGFGEDGVYVAINKKTYFKAIEKWHNNFAIKSSWEVFNFRTLADLNKDGFLDIIGFLNSTTYVAYGDGKKFEGYQVFSQNFESNQYWGLKNPIFLTDINADENLDLFGLYNNYSNNSYYVSNTKFQLKYQYGSFADISWDMEKNTRIMMDMNNDGLPDLFGINDVNQALVGLNTIDSKNPNTITFVRNIWSVLPVKTNHRLE